jgi:hypothetical protein
MSVLYRKRLRNGRAIRTTLTFSAKTLAGLEALRTRFQSRWPEASYPSLSYVLETVLAKNLPLFDNNPVMLERALQEFRRKYPKGTQPKQGKEER